MPASRTLSKSDFALTRTCDAKLCYPENGYRDNREYDPYLRLLARVDILRKIGNVIHLYEVKAKPFDGPEHRASLDGGGPGVFCTQRKPHRVASDLSPQLET